MLKDYALTQDRKSNIKYSKENTREETLKRWRLPRIEEKKGRLENQQPHGRKSIRNPSPKLKISSIIKKHKKILKPSSQWRTMRRRSCKKKIEENNEVEKSYQAR